MSTGFLAPPETTAEAQALFDGDLDELGFVMNVSRLWAYQPGTKKGLFELLRDTTAAAGLSFRERGIVILACASTLGDSYCSIAWGTKVADVANAATASLVLTGDDAALTDSERALAGWARKVARDPSATTDADVQELRDAGYSDAHIFAITVFVALRLAFAIVNDALGARPDAEYRSIAPAAVLDAVKYGRPVDDVSPTP